ncbi:MAG: hypothetical protein ACYCZB_04935 [Acidiphilium sp.]
MIAYIRTDIDKDAAGREMARNDAEFLLLVELAKHVMALDRVASIGYEEMDGLPGNYIRADHAFGMLHRLFTTVISTL